MAQRGGSDVAILRLDLLCFYDSYHCANAIKITTYKEEKQKVILTDQKHEHSSSINAVT